LEGLSLTDLTLLDRTEQRIEFVQLHLGDTDVVQEVLGEGFEMVGGLDQPVQHGVGIDLEHPSHGTDAQPFRQCPHGPNKHVGRYPLPMQRRAMRLKKRPATLAAIELSPLAATGMTVGRDIAQPEPAPIATGGIRTEML
jgi:hypothetical protein